MYAIPMTAHMIHVSDKGHSLLTHLDINCRVYSVYAYARILVIRVYRNYQLIFQITLSTKTRCIRNL